MKGTFNIVMCQDTHKPVCFNLGMMLNMAQLHSLIPVLMVWAFIQAHRVVGKLELVQSFCCKVTWSISNICDGWLCEEDYCEEVL